MKAPFCAEQPGGCQASGWLPGPDAWERRYARRGRGLGAGGSGACRRRRGGQIEESKSYSAADEVDEDSDEESVADNEGVSEGDDASIQREIRDVLLASAPGRANQGKTGQGRSRGGVEAGVRVEDVVEDRVALVQGVH